MVEGEARLRIDKVSDGQVTCLRLTGTIDEQFEGKRLASTLKAGTLVLDLGEVRKISSFGCREWVDFVGDAGARVGDLLLVECAPKVMDQLNMVLNFAGKGRVYSFYAPYRCDYCDVERRVLLQVDRDLDAIRSLKPPEMPCETCGNASYFDEDPAAYFAYVSQQPGFELDPGVAAFLSAKLSYDVEGGARRFRAEKHVEGRATYLRLSGDLDASFPGDKVAEGLEGALVVDLAATGKIDPAGAAAWRAFLAQVSATCEQVWLVSCPPVFLERLARAEDLGRAQVVSLSIPYTCQSCAATASHLIDVDAQFDVLKFATAPEVACPDCGGKTVCSGSEALLSHLGALPRPAVPPEIRKLISTAPERRPAAAAAAAVAAASGPAARSANVPLVLLASVAAALVAVVVVVGWSWLNKPTARVSGASTGALVERSAPERPQWAGAMPPGYAACSAAGAAVTCAGASAQAESQEEARKQAIEAALEALVDWTALTDGLAPAKGLYGPARQRILGDSGATREAVAGRRAVVAALRRTAPSAPAQPASEYWERYEGGTVAYARFDVPAEAVAALRAAYTTPRTALGASAVTAFPGLAWRWPEVASGAQLLEVAAGPLRDAGMSARDVVLEVAGKKVGSADDFVAAATAEVAALEAQGGSMRLLVKSGDGDPRAFNVPVARATEKKPPRPPGERPVGGGNLPAGGVNIWDRTGGGNSRDNPDQ